LRFDRLEPAARKTIDVARIGTANLLQHKVRLLTALSGIAVAMFLLMLQYESLTAVRERVSAFYNLFNFDIALVPDTFQILISPGTLDRVRLAQARTLSGVERTEGVTVSIGPWAKKLGENGNSVLMIGLDNNPLFVRDPAVRRGMEKLTDGSSVLFDDLAQADMRPFGVGTTGTLAGTEVKIAGLFDLGLFFYAAGGVIAPSDMFARLSGRTSGRITLGFLQVAPGADVAKVQAELKEVLPHDVQVLTHDELVAQEQAYFVETKPIGIMMDVGMLIACLVAVTIMIQVLATDIGNRMNEYAVLKAMGFGPFFVYGIGVMQSVILGVVGLLPAVAVSAVVLGIIQERTHLQSGLDLRLSGMALGITLGTAVLASAVVLWRLQRADPAALY